MTQALSVVALPAAALLALDWGTTNLRASLLAADAQVLSTRQDARGVMAVPAGGFEAVLRDLCGDWLAQYPGLPLIASGMVGSRQGWLEAAYLPVPAGPAQAAAALTVVPLGTHRLHIVPGVSSQPRPGRFDVMRGEETQVWGQCLSLQDESVRAEPVFPIVLSLKKEAPPGTSTSSVRTDQSEKYGVWGREDSATHGPVAWTLLPGTHSKWVRVDGQHCISDLHTYMTGELYALLCTHGTPGRLMVQGRRDDAAFAAGVALGAAEHAQATQAMFAARTAGLLGGVAGDALPDYLSGVLIGAEIASARAALPADERAAPVRLIGTEALCARYGQALQQLGAAFTAEAPGATERGLWRVALAAGLNLR